jgi:hypothetical protein
MNYEPPEPTEEEMEEADIEHAVRTTPTVRIEGLTLEAVQVIVRQAVESNYSLREKADAAVEDAVASAVDAALKDAIPRLSDEHLRPRIAEMVAKGWPVTNQYGEQTGSKTFEQILRETLFAKDQYRSHEGPWAMKVFREELEKALKGSLGEDLRKAQQMVREALDGDIMSKLRQAFKDGLGLKEKP